MNKLVSLLLTMSLLSACSFAGNQQSSSDWFTAYDEVTDSVTQYVELKPSELGLTFEESILAIDSYVTRMRTAQMAFEKTTQKTPLKLADGEISFDSVASLNRTLDEFISSQENAAEVIKRCEKIDIEYEAFSCFIDVMSSVSSETNTKYQAFYRANQKFMQDSLN